MAKHRFATKSRKPRSGDVERFIAPWAADNPPSSPIAASFAARKPRAAARLATPNLDPATQKIWAEEHALAFTVAGMARDDILAALRDGLTEVIAGKLSREEWLDGARARLIKAGYWREEGEKGGITPSRLQLIFDTNTANAYHGGRWQRLEERRETHPYLMYLTKRDHRVRPEHRAWEGLILPIDHPFWQTHFPPNGFRCRCAVLGVTQAEYDQLRRDGGQFAGGTVKFDNDIDADLESLDPGFAYNPGIPGSRAAALQRLAEEKAARAEQRAARRAAEAQARAAKKAARDAQRAASAEAEAKEQTTMQPQPAPEPLPAAPKTPEAAPATPEVKPKIAAAIPGQPTYADLGLPKLKDVPEELRLPAPELLRAAPTREEALAVFARELGVSAETPRQWIETKITEPTLKRILVDYQYMPHMVEKERDARERFARFVRMTLEDPFEAWATEYDDGTTRPRLIGLFQGERQLAVILRIEQEGSILYNIMNADDKRLDKLRIGKLLYARSKI